MIEAPGETIIEVEGLRAAAGELEDASTGGELIDMVGTLGELGNGVRAASRQGRLSLGTREKVRRNKG
jgi:hypothetical protein